MPISGRFLGGLALGGALVISTAVGTRGLEKFKQDSQTITVTGSAKRRIQSDLVLWTATVSERADTLVAAVKLLKQNVPRVTAYLVRKGVPENKIVVSSIVSHAIHPHDKDGRPQEDIVTAYVVQQTVQVESGDVDKVRQISREATELIEQGINLQSAAPEYLYTKLADLKIQMLAEAAKDSKVRAEQIANSTAAHLGPLREARMGVMQINPANSTDTSGEGNNDVSSLEKDVIAVVTASFSLN